MSHIYPGFARLASAKCHQLRQFIRRHIRRISLCISAVLVAFVLIANGQFRVSADSSSGVSALIVAQADCGSFAFQASSAIVSGYAAVRIWVNNTSGTQLVDSYIAGYPSYYASFGSPNYGAGKVTFTTQPV